MLRAPAGQVLVHTWPARLAVGHVKPGTCPVAVVADGDDRCAVERQDAGERQPGTGGPVSQHLYAQPIVRHPHAGRVGQFDELLLIARLGQVPDDPVAVGGGWRSAPIRWVRYSLSSVAPDRVPGRRDVVPGAAATGFCQLPLGPAGEVGPWGEGGQDEDRGDSSGGEGGEVDREAVAASGCVLWAVAPPVAGDQPGHPPDLGE